jgi:hypothetical protein
MENGHLACHWFEAGKMVPYDSAWMKERTDIQGSYLTPAPDFASHSPFGVPAWFERYFDNQNF